MLKWFFLVLAISLGILGYLYVNIDGPSITPVGRAGEAANVVVVVHSYQDGVHRFSGEIKLPHSCYSIDTGAELDPTSQNRMIIKIQTKDHILERSTCATFSTRYQFQVIADAPATVSYAMEIDGKDQPIRLVNVDWNNPNAYLVDPR